MKSIPLLCLLLCILAGCTASDEEPYNVVFILIDDMGWTDTAAFGSSFYETPHLDKLAAESMRFTNGYAACPVCSPTRASILTGKYPARLKQTDWIPGRSNRADQQLRQVEDFNYMGLEHQTLANILQNEGYATAHMGKWHLGAGDEYLPENRGFNVNIAGNQYGSPPTYYYPYSRKNWRDTTQIYQLTDLVEGGEEGEYLTDRLGEEAAQYIASKKDEPFFLHFSQYAVHTPLQSRPDLQAKYEAKRTPLPDSADFAYEGKRPVRTVQNHAIYAGMVESMDTSVGRIMQALEDNGMSERTIVIFFSDNGGLSTSEGWPTSNLPLRTGKGWLYEGGIRVPMLIKWPGVTDINQICDTPVSSVDFLPTILDMLGMADKTPANTDGESLTQLLQDNAIARDAIYWHYPHYSNQGGKPGGAIREGNFKLIENYEDASLELYDLDNDIGEQENLVAQMPEKAAELREKLAAWRLDMDAQMPVPNPAYQEE
ncbi:MAG: sulfatase [Rhodothermales bacterium]